MTVAAQDRFSELCYRTCIAGCLLGFVATIYFIAGLNGYVSSPLLNIIVAVVVSLVGLGFLYVLFFEMRGEGRLGLLVWILILGILVVEVTLGLVPPWARDELTHHLAMPALYVRAGRIYEIPFAPYSYYPMLIDMLYVPFVKWGWDSVPKLVHGLFGFLTGVLIYAYAARRLNAIYGLLGFLFFISTPAILRLSNWAYVDLGLAFYSLASILCLLWWVDTRRLGWLILAGLSVGFALATKPNGMLVFFLLCFATVFLSGKIYAKNIGKVCSATSLFLVFALLPFTPWAVKNLMQTGNAFYPMFQGFFASVGSGGGGGGADFGLFGRRALVWGEEWWEIAALPIRVFFAGRDDQPQHFDGVLNPILVLFLPWAFKGKWIEEKKLLFAFVIFYFLYALFLVDLRIRYLLPIVAPLAILLVYGVHNVYLRIRHPSILAGGILILLAFNGAYLWNYFRSVAPLSMITRSETRTDFLRRTLPDYSVFDYINHNLPTDSKIYFIFMGRRGYYSLRNYIHDTGDHASSLVRMIQRSSNESELRAELAKEQLTHLLVRDALLKRYLGTNLSVDKQRLWGVFMNRHLRRIYQDRHYSVYQLHG